MEVFSGLKIQYDGGLDGVVSTAAGEQSGRTCFTNVDCGVLRPRAKAQGTQAVPARPDAGAAVPVQSGVRGLRENPISSAHPEKGSLPGRLFQSGR